MPEDEFERGEMAPVQSVIKAFIPPTLDRLAMYHFPRGLVATALMNVAQDFQEDSEQELEEFVKRATI